MSFRPEQCSFIALRSEETRFSTKAFHQLYDFHRKSCQAPKLLNPIKTSHFRVAE